MPQNSQMTAALKAALKAQNKTYADVARTLGLTQASVKRLFSKEDFSLARLDKVCEMLGLEISDLVQHYQQSRIEQLTTQQEQALIADLKLVVITVCVFSHWTMREIVDFYQITEAECLARLIQLMPNDRIRLLISPNFRWQENGPIERFFREHIGQEYFRQSFTRDEDCLLVLNGMLSRRTNAEFQRKLHRLAKEFNDLTQEDAGLPFDQRNGVTLVMAMRDWNYGLFEALIRK